MSNVIFLDFDGPMIPTRAYWMPLQTNVPTKFCPSAVGLVNRLATKADAQIVVHSHWRKSEWHLEHHPDIKSHMVKQGIKGRHIADNYLCPGSRNTDRFEDIARHLELNKEITNYVIIEDLPLASGYEGFAPKFIKIDFDEGLNWERYNAALSVFGLKDDILFG